MVGGEGFLHRVRHKLYGNCVLKIYKRAERAATLKEKIRYLISHQPEIKNANIKYCWPFGEVYDEDLQTFRGFIMPEAFPNSRDLMILDYSPRYSIAESYPEEVGWHDKFELMTSRGLRNRMVILYNWVVAIKALHATGRYVLVDIKPENILVTPAGKISIIDVDSCQVAENGQLLFENSARTLDYFPWEGYATIKAHRKLDYSCDSFAMGCCIYSLLVGCHPFNNIRLAKAYRDCTTISSRIKQRLYYRGGKQIFIDRIPNMDIHQNVSRLPQSFLELFDRTFGDSTNRPTMEEWRIALKKATQN